MTILYDDKTPIEFTPSLDDVSVKMIVRQATNAHDYCQTLMNNMMDPEYLSNTLPKMYDSIVQELGYHAWGLQGARFILKDEYGAFGGCLHLVSEDAYDFWGTHSWGRRGYEQLYSAQESLVQALRRIEETDTIQLHDLIQVIVNLSPCIGNFKEEYKLS